MDRTFTVGFDWNATRTARARVPRSAASLAFLLAAIAACGRPAKSPPDARTAGVARSAVDGQPTCAGNGAHAMHVQGLGLACSVCHPGGARYGFANAFTYPRGTTSAGGTIALSTATAPASCSVGCHSPMGASPHVVEWTAPGPLACTACHDTAALPPVHPAASPSATRADCQGCHDTASHTSGTVALAGHDAPWMDRASAGFHAFAAERGLSRCRSCHGEDLAGGVAVPACASCHRSGGLAASADFSTCKGCHGGVDDATGAPPRTIWGRGSDAVRVGAHRIHGSGGSAAPPFACGACHAVPVDLFTPGHIDELTDPSAVPTAGVEFAGLATRGGATPSWDRTTGRCAGTYCHGSFPGGNATYEPTWTSPAASACGTCHGLPPGGNHPGVDAAEGLAACSGCHPETVAASGEVIAPAEGGKHLDGAVQATGGHAGSWMDPSSPDFHAHAANRGLGECQGCHGPSLDGAGGTTAVGCAQCHAPGGSGRDFGTCTGCHGGTDDASGAPPAATWGHAGDPSRGGGALDPIRVGAHTAHVRSGSLTQGFDCSVCHVTPASILDAGHIDQPTATVTFGGVASAGTTPAWTRSSATCSSTYCHGGTLTGGTTTTPTWTVADGSQAACGACHGDPPATGRHVQHVISWGIRCEICHPVAAGYVLDPALHVNGAKDLKPGSTATRFGSFADWNAMAAGEGTLQGTATACHGAIYYWTGAPPPTRYGCR